MKFMFMIYHAQRVADTAGDGARARLLTRATSS